MTMSNKLVEIPQEDWPKLRDLYKVDWPNNLVGFYTMDNYINWKRANPSIPMLYVYCVNGHWSDGTFIILDRYQLIINSLNESNDRLMAGLRLLDWNYGYKICCIRAKHYPSVLSIIKEFKVLLEYDTSTVLYYLPKDNALNFRLDKPKDIKLRPMTKEDALTVDKYWPHRHDGSLFLMERIIKLNLNIGAYDMKDELIGWCCRQQVGALTTLQVKEENKRRGVGTLVTKAMAINLAELGEDTFACVIGNNQPSRKLFENLGFKNIQDVFWLGTLPLH